MIADRDTVPGPDQDLAQLLRRTAQEHEPDVERMLRRVRGAAAPTVPPPRAGVPGWVTGWGGAGLAAAAVAAVLVVGTNLLTPTQPPSEAPAASPAPAEPPMVSARAAASAADPEVRLTATQTRDWVVAGADPVDPTALLRADSTERLLGTRVEGDATSAVAAGPYTVRYEGGFAPTVSGQVGGRWWQAGARTPGEAGGFVVSVEQATDRQDLTVWAGVGGADARLALLVDGEVVYTLTLPAPPEPMGYVLTAPLDQVSDAARVELRLVTGDAGDAGVVGFAAASVQ